MITCCNCGRNTSISNVKLAFFMRSKEKVFAPEERDDRSDDDQKIYDSIPENERYTYGLTHRSVVEAIKKLHSKKTKELRVKWNSNINVTNIATSNLN